MSVSPLPARSLVQCTGLRDGAQAIVSRVGHRVGDVRRPGERRLLHHLLVQPGVSGVGEQTAWARLRVRWRNRRFLSAIRIADERCCARHAAATLRPGERRGDASHVPLGPHGAEPAGERACERDLRRWAESGAIGVGCSGHPVVIGASQPLQAQQTPVGCIGPVRRGLRSRPAPRQVGKSVVKRPGAMRRPLVKR